MSGAADYKISTTNLVENNQQMFEYLGQTYTVFCVCLICCKLVFRKRQLTMSGFLAAAYFTFQFIHWVIEANRRGHQCEKTNISNYKWRRSVLVYQNRNLWFGKRIKRRRPQVHRRSRYVFSQTFHFLRARQYREQNKQHFNQFVNIKKDLVRLDKCLWVSSNVGCKKYSFLGFLRWICRNLEQLC